MRWGYTQDAASRIICTPSGPLGKLQYNMLLLVVFLSPQAVGKEGSFSLQSFLLGFLSLMGLGLLLKGIVPKKERRKKKKRNRRKSFTKRGCGTHNNAEQTVNAIILILVLVEIALVILGVFLIIAGLIFWGVFAMLILPVLCALAVLVFLATLC